MKKQVTFAEGRLLHRLCPDDALRYSGMNESKMASTDNRQPAAGSELQHVTTTSIPKSMTAAPFLMHTALTPAQKQYLYSVAASCSTTHVRNIITQHYMNVLHRCIRAGYNSERDNNLVGTSVNEASEVPSKTKHRGKFNTGTRNPGKSFLPKIPNRQARWRSEANS